jgi:hypothetical protein
MYVISSLFNLHINGLIETRNSSITDAKAVRYLVLNNVLCVVQNFYVVNNAQPLSIRIIGPVRQGNEANAIGTMQSLSPRSSFNRKAKAHPLLIHLMHAIEQRSNYC